MPSKILNFTFRHAANLLNQSSRCRFSALLKDTSAKQMATVCLQDRLSNPLEMMCEIRLKHTIMPCYDHNKDAIYPQLTKLLLEIKL